MLACSSLFQQDPGFATFLFDQLQVPDWPVQGGHEASRCPVCATSVQQLRQQALHALQDLCPGTELVTVPALPSKTFPGQPTRVTTHGMLTLSSRPPASRIPHPAHSMLPVAEQRRGLGWASSTKPSVQVTVGGNALSGTLSSVTIQAQQYLEGMWSISRVNNFLPQLSPVSDTFLFIYFSLSDVVKIVKCSISIYGYIVNIILNSIMSEYT